MQVKFADGTTAQTIPGGLRHTSRYSAGGRFVLTAPYTDRQERETFLGATFGSMDWLTENDDEFRFDSRTCELVGVMVAVPEEMDQEWDGGAWLRLPGETGGLRAELTKAFSVRPVEVRWVGENASVIVGAYRSAITRTHGLRRLTVASGFDLVVGDDGYAGWILENPADRLVHAFELPPTGPAPEGLRKAVAEFLDLFVEPRIELMQDEDPVMRVRLDALLDRVSALEPDPRSSALRDWLTQVLEDWYGVDV
ncbi:hypothetical protein ABZ611_01505 [Streptomyces sp. NPDC007861]|uniref:hypothetical protein n=1 Tax=Streptomyces sp. NPDC007861 TaxID=3154893 RepID=UPI0033FE94A1